MADEPDTEEARRPFWRNVGNALAKVTTATGRGALWLAKTGYDQRNYVPATINGAVGDKLAQAGHALAIRMSFRVGGRDVPARALGDLCGHAAVFVHGLMADEACFARPLGDGQGLGPMLARERRLAPVYLRYNSGLHVSENGRALARMLEHLISVHPGIDRITLIGHSMGGLVVRSAGHYGSASGHRWLDLTDSVVLLGAPNDGAYLEQLAQLSAWVLDAVPTLTTRTIAQVLHARSDGIKDLRLGLLVDEDWRRADVATMRLDNRTRVPPMRGVRYHVAIGTLTESADSVLAAYFGDGLVGGNSARVVHDAAGATAIRWRVFTKTTHLGLITSPDVQRFVSDALAT